MAAEIDRIDALMWDGDETDEEFLRLCKLLFDFGFVSKSEELLRANSGDDGPMRDLYIQLHGTDTEVFFTDAVERFSNQFGVTLTRVRGRTSRYLCHQFECEIRDLPSEIPNHLRILIENHPEIHIHCFGLGVVTGDVVTKPLGYEASVPSQPMVFESGHWVLVEWNDPRFLLS